MSPAEHYAEAERLLALANPRTIGNTDQRANILREAIVHALLAKAGQ